jgi:hypothetical protein
MGIAPVAITHTGVSPRRGGGAPPMRLRDFLSREASMRSISRSSFSPLLATLVLLAACAEREEASVLTTEVRVDASARAASPAAPRNFRAHNHGGEEVPPVATRARGQATFQVARDGESIRYRLIVANIENVTQAHIHRGERGVNGPVVVWLYPEGPPSQLIEGRFSGILAEGTITEADLVGQLAGQPLSALVELMQDEAVYVNIHTSQFPPGEIRGQIR